MAYGLAEECDFIQNELKNYHYIYDNHPPNEINYYSEVYSVMHAFGDVKKPLECSVNLMHNILEHQMALLIKHAEDVMKLRNGKKITHEDVLFLMRKNKVLLKRLLQFLSVEDAKAGYPSSLKKSGGEFSPEKGERVSKCLKYLGFIEKFTGDLTSVLSDENIFDLIYMKRLKRRDLMANSMTNEEYQCFFETLRITFCQKYTKERFKRWLQKCSSIMTEIAPLGLSIIHFLARETVAGIVDKALEIKSRKNGKSDNFFLENFTNLDDQFCELEYDLDKPENNLQLSLSRDPEDSSSSESNDEEDSTGASTENKVDENNINKGFYFSLNFQEKPFIVGCDGSKTFEIGTSSIPERKKSKKSVDIEKDLTSHKVELLGGSDLDNFMKEDSNSPPLLSDFGKQARHLFYTTPQNTNLKVHWFPEEAITPTEIQAAFVYYQHPSPLSYFMKTKICNLLPRETKLVCLVNPDDFV